MDRARYSAIAHASLDHCNPISAATLLRSAEIAGVRAGSRVLDIGCGKAAFLCLLAERVSRGIRGVGVEKSERIFAEAERRKATLENPASVELHHGDAASFLPTLADHSFDLTVCIGSSHAVGDARSALVAMQRLTKPGGHILLGEGFWQKKPDPEYLDSIGGSESEMTDHAGNISRGASLGLTALWAVAADQREWDEYEWAYARGIEDFVAANPSDPDAATMLSRCRGWRDTYLRYGRGTMGFGLYVFRNPNSR